MIIANHSCKDGFLFYCCTGIYSRGGLREISQAKDSKDFKVMLSGSSHSINMASKKLKAFVALQKPEAEKDLAQRYLWVGLLSYGLKPNKICRRFIIFLKKSIAIIKNTASLG